MRKIKKAALMLALSLVASTTCYAATETDAEFDAKAQDGTIYAYSVTDVLTGESEAPEDYDFSFDSTVEADGVKYQLDHIEYSVQSLYEKQYGEEELPYSIEVKEKITGEEKEI